MATWYRYEDRCYAQLSISENGCDSWRSSGPRVELREMEVLRETPKGVWLTLGFGDKRFVLREARKQYACPTKEAAMASFIARKKRQLSIYEARAATAREALRQAERMMTDVPA